MFSIVGEIFVAIYVNDVLVTTMAAQIRGFKEFLAVEYKLKMPCEAIRPCGINSSQDGDVALVEQIDLRGSRRRSESRMRGRFGSRCRRCRRSTPTELLFFVTQTRPELPYSIGALGRYKHCFQD